MEIEYEGYCRTVELKGLVFLFANWREGRISHLQANNMWMKLNHAKKCVLKTWQLTTWLFFRVSISEKPMPLPKTLSIKKNYLPETSDIDARLCRVAKAFIRAKGQWNSQLWFKLSLTFVVVFFISVGWRRRRAGFGVHAKRSRVELAEMPAVTGDENAGFQMLHENEALHEETHEAAWPTSEIPPRINDCLCGVLSVQFDWSYPEISSRGLANFVIYEW